jgi:hypothetical protein
MASLCLLSKRQCDDPDAIAPDISTDTNFVLAFQALKAAVESQIGWQAVSH